MNKNHTLYGLDINQTLKAGVNRVFSWEQLDEIPAIEAYCTFGKQSS